MANSKKKTTSQDAKVLTPQHQNNLQTTQAQDKKRDHTLKPRTLKPSGGVAGARSEFGGAFGTQHGTV